MIDITPHMERTGNYLIEDLDLEVGYYMMYYFTKPPRNMRITHFFVFNSKQGTENLIYSSC